MELRGETRGDARSERMALMRRYALILRLAYVVLVASAVGFFALQIDDREKAEWRTIAGRAKEHALILDALADAVAARVKELQETASLDIDRDDSDHFDHRSIGLAADGRLMFKADGDRQIPPTAAVTGSLGLVELDAAAAEVRTAVRLLDDFRYLVALLPIVDRAYYVSARDLAIVLPATPSLADQLVSDAMRSALLDAVSARRNPTGSPVWLDGSDVPGARSGIFHLAPVFLGDQLVGTVVLQVSTPYLGRVNGDFDYPVGGTILLGPGGAVLAYPQAVQSAVTLGAAYRNSVPEAVARNIDVALNRPDRQAVGSGAVLTYVERLEAAPWTLVYIGDRWAILAALVAEHGPQTLALVIVLTIMLLIAGWLTRREFVEPASRLVEHIKAAGEVGPSGLPRVPVAWRPWFRTVTAVFQENADLVRIRQELQIARDMQAAVLPRQPLQHGRLGIVGRMQPALEVGGDFYDYFQIDDDRVGVVIADVSGKGVPASLFMMVTRTLLKAAGIAGDGPGACLGRVNNLLEAENDAAMFVTVFYGVIDVPSGTMVYANGGHNPPHVLKADGSILTLSPLGDPILAVVPGATFREGQIALRPGDALLLYTDGLTEAFSAEGEEFGDERLIEALSQTRGQSSAEVADHCLAVVDGFAEGAAQSDDMTCLVARIEPTS